MSSVPTPAPAVGLADEEVGQRAEAGRALPREREPDRRALVVEREERDLRLEDLADLGELLLEVVRPLVRRRRDLVVELPPELRERVVVVGRRAADVHPSEPRAHEQELRGQVLERGEALAHASRTSGIVSGRPSA